MKGKVIVVDDDPKIGRLLKFRLSKAGYDAHYFSAGKDALENIPKIKPHLIISDIEMPVMTGYEFCEHVRRSPGTAYIPFIFLSGRTDATDQLEGFRLGADDYVCKPVNIDFLLERMGKVLDRSARAKSFQTQADFSGNLSQMSLNDVIQIVESNQKTGELEFTTGEGKTLGRILFRRGNLVKAQFGVLEGTEAFYGLMDEEEGFFEFFARDIDEPEQITISNMAALLQGSRLIDEGRSLYDLTPDLDVFLTRTAGEVPPISEDRFGKDYIRKIMKLVDRRATVREIINGGKMSRPRAGAILADLLRHDIIAVHEAEAISAETPKKPRSVLEGWLLKLLHNVESQKLTGRLEIGNRPEKQVLFFKNGRVVNAFHGRTIGQKALYRIFSESGGAPKFYREPVVISHEIDKDLDYLLEDGDREVRTIRELRRRTTNNAITIHTENMEKVSRIKTRPGLQDVLTLVQQLSRVQDVIDASPYTDLRTFNHLLTLVKLNVIDIER